MEKKLATLQDVADRTGYSINTVSRALKDLPIVTEKTRRVIQDTAREMGYVPNRAARALRYGRSHTIAYITGSLLNPYFAMQHACIHQTALDNGYTATVFSSHENADSELKSIRAALEFGVDGIILVPTQQSEASLDLLENSRVPFVLLARRFDHRDADSVVCDEEAGGRLAARHLLEQGHHAFAYVCDRGVIRDINLRRIGFENELRDAGLQNRLFLIPPEGDSDERLRARFVAKELARLHREEGVTGVAAFCDMTLRYILAELHGADPALESALSYVAFDNIDDFLPFPLPLCSVSADYQAMCAEAVLTLIRRIGGDTSPTRHAVYPVRLTCRGSCRAARPFDACLDSRRAPC